MLKDALEKFARIGRQVKDISHLSPSLCEKLQHLQEHGYVQFDHYVGTTYFEEIKKDFITRLENKLEFKAPNLAQSKISLEKHKDLIDNNFLATTEQLKELGLTFDKSDVKNYNQVISEFMPSTLTLEIPDSYDYFNIWLDPELIQVAEAYMGFTPHLTEAYIRRNFPARIPVMNHYWHRDRNHKKHLLKAFVFFSDCTMKTGPHHYISGSIKDQSLYGKNYYSDEEVKTAYPEESQKEIISVVPAGTIILEDTRGLHKAGVPDEGFRDLGFSVFLPPISLKRHNSLFKIGRDTYNQLSCKQKKYINKSNIINSQF